MLLTEEEALDKLCVVDIHVKCETSKCMGWRWYDSGKKKGYCGLAGNPENKGGKEVLA